MDWWDEKQYAYTKTIDNFGWAWEFLRRNPEYRKAFAKYVRLIKKLETKHGTLSKLNRDQKTKIPELWYYDPLKKKGQTDQEWRMYCMSKDLRPWRRPIDEGMARQWGLKQMIDPHQLTAGKNLFFKPKPISLVHSNLDDLIHDFDLPNEDDGVSAYAAFDLRFSVTKQLKEVKEILMRQQKLVRAKSGKRVRKRKSIYKTYLRVLDAKEVNATDSDIGTMVFPNLIDEPPDYNRRKRAFDTFAQANRLTEPEEYFALVRAEFRM